MFGTASLFRAVLRGKVGSCRYFRSTSFIRRNKTRTTRSNEGPEKKSVMFELTDAPGSLEAALKFFWKNDISMTRIESRPSKMSSSYQFFVDFDANVDEQRVENLLGDLSDNSLNVTLTGSKEVPWFPRKFSEVDVLSDNVLGADAGDLEADHPGFHDETYKERRKEIASLAFEHRLGQIIKRVDYTKSELETWNTIFTRLVPLIEKHGCAEYNRMFPLVRENCGFSPDNIPQLQDISEFLSECTGFQLRPVAGLLGARDFLHGLAFRIFFCTQYIRHPSKPLYTPEPDLVHELMGHAPMFADQEFADFTQSIGLASIGATDEQIDQLARCYWYSVEFGVCEQNGQHKAYGAGLLSSFGELGYMAGVSDEPNIPVPKFRSWDPNRAAQQEYPITRYQPLYYVAKSFNDATEKLTGFAESFNRPFNVRFNDRTKCIDVDRNISRAQRGENA